MLAYLEKTKQSRFNSSVYLAVASAIVASVLAALAFKSIAGGFEGRSEELFEGVTMFLAAALLTTMILWMGKQKHVREELERKVGAEVVEGHRFGIFMLVFLSVMREGVETVIFLGATGFSAGANAFWNFIGGMLGIVLALAVGFLLFVQSRKLDIKKFFQATSLLLILFAAGLTAHGVHELEKAGVLPIIVEHVWDINSPKNPDGSYPLLHEEGLIGGLAKNLFGYNGNPSLLEVASYVGYLVVVWLLFRNIESIHKVI